MKMKIKKIIKLLCIFSLLSAGCAKEAASADTDTPHTPKAEDILITGTGTADMKYYGEMTDCLKDSQAVVYGEVTDFSMFAAEGSGAVHTLETVHIIETLYGEAEEGTDVILLLMGGYVPIIEHINAHRTEEERQAYFESEDIAKLSEEELHTKYFAQVSEGYYYPETGERGIYFLKPVPQLDVSVPWKETDHVFWCTGEWQSLYRQVSEGVFLKPNSKSSLSDPDGKYSGDTVTYDELKEQIRHAAEELGAN